MSDQPFSKSEMMIVAAARELAGQRVCFVGVGLPNIAVNLAQRTVAPELELVYEAGVFGARPARLLSAAAAERAPRRRAGIAVPFTRDRGRPMTRHGSCTDRRGRRHGRENDQAAINTCRLVDFAGRMV